MYFNFFFLISYILKFYFLSRYSLDNEEYCTFSNYDQNKILGTRAKIATVIIEFQPIIIILIHF